MSRARLTIALLALLTPLAGAATPAAASTTVSNHPSDTVLHGAEIAVKSSTGRTLDLSIDVDRFSASPGPLSTTLQVGLGDNAGEFHLWQLNVTNHSFTYDLKLGRGTVHTGPKQIAPLGHVDLTITPRGPSRSHSCASGDSWIKQTVTLTGSVLFTTRSAAWGRVGSPAHPLTFKGDSTVETDYGNLSDACFDPLDTCAGSVGWQSPGGDQGAFFGQSFRRHGKQRDFFQFLDTHSIAAPAGATIDDDALVTLPAPTLVTRPDGTKVLTVRAGKHGLVTGSATFRSTGPPTTHMGSCRDGVTKNWPASYTNGTNPLAVHLDIGGTVQNRNRATGAAISQDPR